MSDIRSRGSVGQNMLSRRGQIRGFEGDGKAAPSQADHGGKMRYSHFVRTWSMLAPFPVSQIAAKCDEK